MSLTPGIDSASNLVPNLISSERLSAPYPISFLSPADVGFALWLIVPVKPFGEGKSRLAAVLSPEMRAELSQRWLTHLLTVAKEWGGFVGMAVISRDAAVLSFAAAMGATPIGEMGDDLNDALTQACEVAARAGAEGVLMLPSDLPLLTITDLDELFELAVEEDGVVIAPSHDGGTNALLLRPPQAIAYAFGEGSFARHLALTAAAGLPCHVYHSATLALDVDCPEDLLFAGV
jgi:2-phospho-L-lactate guanylyltransferase